MGFRHGRQILSFYLVLITVNIIVLASMVPEITAQTASSNSFVPAEGNLLPSSNNVSDPIKQSDDTVRVDPLDHLKKYRGGFDITNKHYWSSTVFTGIYGYALGVLWLLCGVTYGGYLLISHFFFKDKDNETRKKGSHCHKQCYLFPILLAIFLTLLAMVASSLVLGGNARFHSEAKSVVNIIINTANEASENIFKTTGAMKDVRDNLGISNENAEVVSFITSTSQELDSEASNIQRQAKKNRHLINKGLKIVYMLTTVTVSLNLVAVMALSDL